MKKSSQADKLELSWDEISFITGGMTLALRPISTATNNITKEYSLGRRGAWILILISTGHVFPLELTNVFRVGRSLVTAELTRLTEAGLINYRKSNRDGRRTELALTPLGEKVCLQVRELLTNLVIQRLSGYTRSEILLCARLLRDFSLSESESEAANLSRTRRLDQIIDKKHPLIRLAGKIDWQRLEAEATDSLSGAVPPGQSRFIVALFLLTSIYGLSDDELHNRWVYDPYFQYFTGQEFFAHAFSPEQPKIDRCGRQLRQKMEALAAETLRAADLADEFKALKAG